MRKSPETFGIYTGIARAIDRQAARVRVLLARRLSAYRADSRLRCPFYVALTVRRGPHTVGETVSRVARAYSTLTRFTTLRRRYGDFAQAAPTGPFHRFDRLRRGGRERLYGCARVT